jgi:hypothetical protein
VRKLRHRLALIAATGMLLTGVSAGVTALGAGPALADTCYDGTNSSGGVYSAPDGGIQIGSFGSGAQVSGNCTYWNNNAQGRWYMAVGWQGRTGYIWVQRLIYGSEHECLDGQNVYSIGSSHCLLYNA